MTKLLDDETQRRVDALVDRDAYVNDAWYHAQVAAFKTWLRLTEQALADEGVAPEVTRRVLNRLAYGAPQSADSYPRRDELQRRVDQVRFALQAKELTVDVSKLRDGT